MKLRAIGIMGCPPPFLAFVTREHSMLGGTQARPSSENHMERGRWCSESVFYVAEFLEARHVGCSLQTLDYMAIQCTQVSKASYK